MEYLERSLTRYQGGNVLDDAVEVPGKAILL